LRIGDPDDVSGISLLRTEARDALGLRQIWEQDGFDPYYRMVGSATRFRAHHMFDQNQLARDLRAMYPENSGYEMRDPHADRELLEFCLSVPEWLYRKDGVERWFARQVFADRLPPEILNEQRRGMQVPNWFDFLNARKDAIAEEVERMEASPMTCRLIDVPRAKQLIAEWPKDAHEAQNRQTEYCLNLDRAVHVGQFIRWVEGGNA
jgi:asparagine synthase (glutamine-hydrolysing)